MKAKDIHTEVRLHPRRRIGWVAEVRIFDRCFHAEIPVPGGFISCEVEHIPEVIKALRWALKTAKEDFEEHPDPTPYSDEPANG